VDGESKLLPQRYNSKGMRRSILSNLVRDGKKLAKNSEFLFYFLSSAALVLCGHFVVVVALGKHLEMVQIQHRDTNLLEKTVKKPIGFIATLYLSTAISAALALFG
jgi:hypothetical protein